MSLSEYHGQDQSILAERERMAAEHTVLWRSLAGMADELRAELIQKHPLLSWRVEPMLPTRELLVTASVIVNAQKLTVKHSILDNVFERERDYAVQALAYSVARGLAEAMLSWRGAS